MAHHQDAKFPADTEQQEAVFRSAVRVVAELDSLRIEKDRARLLERNAVLPPVRQVFPFIPFEFQLIHNYTVNTAGPVAKGSFSSPNDSHDHLSMAVRGH